MCILTIDVKMLDFTDLVKNVNSRLICYQLMVLSVDYCTENSYNYMQYLFYTHVGI